MKDNIFTPESSSVVNDDVTKWLQVSANTFFILTLGLLPIFFLPGIYVSLGLAKTFFVILGLFVTILLFSLATLRFKQINFVFPVALPLFWVFVLITIASALLSGDKIDSIYGNGLEVQTVAFFVVFGLVMFFSFIFGQKEKVIKGLFLVMILSTLVLFLYQILRLFLGSSFLSFGIFNTDVSSLIGSFNDLALYAGLVVMVILLLHNFFNRTIFSVVFVVVLLLALVMLAVINFSVLWFALGFFSLLNVLYLLTRDTWLKSGLEETKPVPKIAFILSGLVAIFSFTFIIAGDFLSEKINQTTNISYIEVKPSFDVTSNIAKAVYLEDAFLGVGTNRFVDAWRMYKDPVINQTEFWSTDFTAGNSLISTIFITTGIAGGITLIVFLLFFIFTAYRTLFSITLKTNWYLIGLVSYSVAIYLWFMSLVYVPGSALMIFNALFTGLALATYVTAGYGKVVNINLGNKRQYGFILMTIVLVVIVISSYFVQVIGKQFVAQVEYSAVLRDGESTIEEIDKRLSKSERLFKQDIFTAERAKLRLNEINRLIALEEPVKGDEQKYQSALIEGINLAQKAISLDPTNPLNHALSASFYGLLNPKDYVVAKDRRNEVFAKISELDPTNPSYYVLWAQLAMRQGDNEIAREKLTKAINLKADYVEALLLLSQLDILEKKTESAIGITRSIINIEPNNPVRYFQLGILLNTTGDLDEARLAFEKAVSIDPNFANARYFLALNYLDLDRQSEALEQLKIVQITNPDNIDLRLLITDIESGDYQKYETGFTAPVNDSSVVSTDEEVTTSADLLETDLITPVNQSSVIESESGVVTSQETN